MRVMWLCGLPEEVRVHGAAHVLCSQKCAAWGWVLGHLPPPQDVELHIVCPVRYLVEQEVHFTYKGASWHCFREIRGEQYLLRIPVFLKIRKFVKLFKPDVINGWGGETGCGWIATLLSKRAVVNVQGLLLLLYAQMAKQHLQKMTGKWLDLKMRDWVEKWTYRRASLLLTESNLSHDALQQYYGHVSKVIYQPLRGQFLLLRSKVERMDENPTFLYLGELVDRKGTMDALRAFAAIRNVSARMFFVGAGPLRDCAHHFVDDSGLQNRVKFYEGLSPDQILSLMDVSDFYILPSYGDTGPTSLKEALSQGLYPICYDNTGPKEHIERYGFGALGKTGEWKSLVPLMEYACAHREELREKGREASERVRHDLSPANIWPKILAAYGEVAHA